MCWAPLSSSYTLLRINPSTPSTRFYILRFSQVRLLNISRGSATNWSTFLSPAFLVFIIQTSRFPPLLLHRRCFHPHHGLHFRPQVRTLKSPHLHFYLLSRRLSQRYGHQRFWRSRQANIWRQQSIHPSQHICFHDHCCIIHHRPDELLQQSPRYLLDQCVGSNPLAPDHC